METPASVRLSNCSILVFGAWAMSYVCVHVFYVICLFIFLPWTFLLDCTSVINRSQYLISIMTLKNNFYTT